jgi:hypothetical protein
MQRGKMWMIVASVILGGAVLLGAQGSGLTLQTPAQPLTSCPTPIAGMNTLCSGPDGFYTASGTAALAKNGAGATGPAGPQGIQGIPGATGATGPQGPAGTLPATFNCTSMTVTATGVALGGCK